MTAMLRQVIVRDVDGNDTTVIDPWQFVPETEINRELREFFAKNPKQESVWLVPCRYGQDGNHAWTCSFCVELPFSNPHRRHYGRSFSRIF